jgi:putative addiction module killer protein
MKRLKRKQKNKNSIDIVCPIRHTNEVKVRQVEYFVTESGKAPAKEWLDGLKDKITQAILYKRIRQAGMGNFGKTRFIGHGIQELKIDYGPGYRIYYGIYQDRLILLLMAGTKSSQQSDINKAKVFWTEWQECQNEI